MGNHTTAGTVGGRWRPTANAASETLAVAPNGEEQMFKRVAQAYKAGWTRWRARGRSSKMVKPQTKAMYFASKGPNKRILYI